MECDEKEVPMEQQAAGSYLGAPLWMGDLKLQPVGEKDACVLLLEQKKNIRTNSLLRPTGLMATGLSSRKSRAVMAPPSLSPPLSLALSAL